jgi:hypothetical protein
MRIQPQLFLAIFLLLSTCFLTGCSSQEIMPASVESGKDFFPLKVGNSWIYQVDSTRYISRFVTSLNTIVTDTFRGRYYIKETIADSIGLQEGNPFFRIELFHAIDSSGPWQIDSVWSIQRGTDKILKTENNRPIVKLKFPISEGSRWDGNQYNSLQDSSGTFWYKATRVNKSVTFRNNSYPGVLVIEKADSNCLGKDDFSTTYLRDIGPAFILKSSLIYSQEGPDPCGSIPKIESGRIRTYNLIRFEKNP